jgi:hypothetical protein
MVAGDICENPLVAAAWVELVAVEALLERLKGSVEASLNPVACADDDVDVDVDVDEVSDWMAFSADDAAPRANSMAELRQMPHRAAFYVCRVSLSKRRAIAKTKQNQGFCIRNRPSLPAINAAAAEFSARSGGLGRIAPRT